MQVIHKEYQKLFETTVEPKLLEKFTKEEINSLYEEVKSESNKYKELNNEAYNALIQQCDFDQFKELFMKYRDILKKMNASKEERGASKPITLETFDNDINKFNALKAEDISEGNPHGWKKFVQEKESSEFNLEMWAKPNNDNHMIRQEFLMKGIKLESMIKLMKDMQLAKGPYH